MGLLSQLKPKGLLAQSESNTTFGDGVSLTNPFTAMAQSTPAIAKPGTPNLPMAVLNTIAPGIPKLVESVFTGSTKPYKDFLTETKKRNDANPRLIGIDGTDYGPDYRQKAENLGNLVLGFGAGVGNLKGRIDQIAKSKDPAIVSNTLKEIGVQKEFLPAATKLFVTVDDPRMVSRLLSSEFKIKVPLLSEATANVVKPNGLLARVETPQAGLLTAPTSPVVNSLEQLATNHSSAKEAVAKGLTEEQYVDRGVNDLFNQLDVIEKRQRELHGIDLLDESKARRIKISTQLDNLAKQTTRLNRDLSESQLRTEYQAEVAKKVNTETPAQVDAKGVNSSLPKVVEMENQVQTTKAIPSVSPSVQPKKKKIPLLSLSKSIPQELEEKMLRLELKKEALDNSPLKSLEKYVAKRGENKGLLPELGQGKGLFAQRGDVIAGGTQSYGLSAQEMPYTDDIIQKFNDEYLPAKAEIKRLEAEVKTAIKENRSQEILNALRDKMEKHQEKLVDFANKYPKLAAAVMPLSKEATKGAKIGYAVGETVGKSETKIKLKATFDAKIEKINTIKDIAIRRRTLIRSIRDHFELTDSELRSITQKDTRLMDNFEFKKFVDDIRVKAESVQERREAQIQLQSTIQNKQLQKEDNLRRAMDLPMVRDMTTAQIRQFDEALQPFQTGDEFLTTRKLELIDRTDFKGVKTVREARVKLSEKLGMKVEDLPKISVTWIDRLSFDSVLANKDPFFKAFVEGYNQTIFEGDAIYLRKKKEISELAYLARKGKGFVDAFVPQDSRVIEYLESADKIAVEKKMTPAEIKMAQYMQKELTANYNHMLQMETLKSSSYENVYFPHIQRGVLESLKDGGIKTAVKEMFQDAKMEEAVLTILDQKTGVVLPLEKFFKFAMHRTGNIVPTQNATKAFLIYQQAFERKKALDKIIPELMVWIDVLTPQSITKGGIVMDDRIATFAKEWINTKKGRPVKLIISPGSTGDFILRSLRAFTALKYVSGITNLPVQLSSSLGVEAGLYTSLGAKKLALGIYRMNTKSGKSFVAKYENFVGENPWDDFVDPAKGLAEKAWGSMYILFRDAVVRGNKQFLLGSITKEEFSSGFVSSKRLSELRTKLGRWLPANGASSIIGATTEVEVLAQFKTWAIPPLKSSMDNLITLGKMIKNKQNPLKSDAFMELFRIAQISAVVGLVTYAVGIEEKPASEQTFVDKLIRKALRDSMSMVSAIDPRTWTSTPGSIDLVFDLGNAISDLVKMVEYEKSGNGYEKGDLKGVNALKKVFIPTAFLGGKNKTPFEKDMAQADKLNAEYKEKNILPIYEQAKALDAQGKQDEADALYEALSDEDKELYGDIVASEKRKTTIQRQEELYPLVKKAQKLDAEGKVDEADALYDDLSEEDQRIYGLVLKKIKDLPSETQTDKKSFLRL